METINLKLQGMSCAACANSIEKSLSRVSGVSACNVNFALSQATVDYDDAKLQVDHLIAAVVDAGYQAQLIRSPLEETDEEQAASQAEQRELTQKVIVGCVVSSIIVFGAIPMMTGLDIPGFPMWLHDPILQLVLSLPVFIWCGSKIFISAWKAFTRHTADMNTLVSVGTIAAYVYSLWTTFFPQFFEAQGLPVDYYYEIAVVIITLILLGRLLENRAKKQTSEAIRALMGLQAKTARVIRNGQEEDIPVEAVEIGDVVVVRPGEKNPRRWRNPRGTIHH